MGVAVGRYIDILIIIIIFPNSTCISSFLAAASLQYFFVHLKNVFSFLFYILLMCRPLCWVCVGYRSPTILHHTAWTEAVCTWLWQRGARQASTEELWSMYVCTCMYYTVLYCYNVLYCTEYTVLNCSVLYCSVLNIQY